MVDEGYFLHICGSLPYRPGGEQTGVCMSWQCFGGRALDVSAAAGVRRRVLCIFRTFFEAVYSVFLEGHIGNPVICVSFFEIINRMLRKRV